MTDNYFIGINGIFHDTAVVVLSLKKNEPIIICSEDRHSGIPHHSGFPYMSLCKVLEKIDKKKVKAVGISYDKMQYRYPPKDFFYDVIDIKNIKKFNKDFEKIFIRLEKNYPKISFLKKDVSKILKWSLKSNEAILSFKIKINYCFLMYIKLQFVENKIKEILPKITIKSFVHHLTHAATYYASSFKKAAVITWDGQGEFDTTVLWSANKESITRISTVTFPNSLGKFYELFSVYLGFNRVSGPGKTMGLSAYGDDRFSQIANKLILSSSNSFDFKLNPKYFKVSKTDYLDFTNEFKKKIGKPRLINTPIKDYHKSIAKMAQQAIEKTAVHLVKFAIKKIGTKNIVLSGGLALNCVLNEVIREKTGAKCFLLPACSDDGSALGAATLLRYIYKTKSKKYKNLRIKYNNSYGLKNKRSHIYENIKKFNLIAKETDEREIASLLEKNKFIGFISEKYEFGPRALGFRSLLADPRKLSNWNKINKEIKFREDFRPFAPVILEKDAKKLWGKKSKPTSSPYMLLAPKMSIKAKKIIPAALHVDYTSRIQTVTKNFNPILYRILIEFKKRTGVGCLLNTSLNMAGESIIIEFKDLIRFLAVSNLDAAIINNLIIIKKDNVNSLNAIKKKYNTRKKYYNARRIPYNNFLNNHNYIQNKISYLSLFKNIF